jgi:hypothetical protein
MITRAFTEHTEWRAPSFSHRPQISTQPHLRDFLKSILGPRSIERSLSIETMLSRLDYQLHLLWTQLLLREPFKLIAPFDWHCSIYIMLRSEHNVFNSGNEKKCSGPVFSSSPNIGQGKYSIQILHSPPLPCIININGTFSFSPIFCNTFQGLKLSSLPKNSSVLPCCAILNQSCNRRESRCHHFPRNQDTKLKSTQHNIEAKKKSSARVCLHLLSQQLSASHSRRVSAGDLNPANPQR